MFPSFSVSISDSLPNVHSRVGLPAQSTPDFVVGVVSLTLPATAFYLSCTQCNQPSRTMVLLSDLTSRVPPLVLLLPSLQLLD